LFDLEFDYCVSPKHPLAKAPEPLSNALLQQHRAIAVGDSARRLPLRTSGLLSGQDSVVVPSMQAKVDAQVAGLGAGYLARWFAAPYLRDKTLIAKRTEERRPAGHLVVAWKSNNSGRALQWWRERLRDAKPPK
jgi:DNA-binding transcriptional LysR family regulator